MKKCISVSVFRDEFQAYGRGDQFSYDGLTVLYDYLEDLHGVLGDYDLDVIELCCSYAEYKSFEELKSDYQIETLEELQQETMVLEVGEKGLLIAQY